MSHSTIYLPLINPGQTFNYLMPQFDIWYKTSFCHPNCTLSCQKIPRFLQTTFNHQLITLKSNKLMYAFSQEYIQSTPSFHISMFARNVANNFTSVPCLWGQSILHNHLLHQIKRKEWINKHSTKPNFKDKLNQKNIKKKQTTIVTWC